jgi:SAM-dependent methyltransferase
MMLGSRETALAFPRRDLSLGFCGACGFVTNVIFDPHVQHYTTGYEAQQSFSPRFQAFQTELVARLIERYHIRDKDVVEIGCGNGDFLIELCEAGGNRGVGIDPAYEPERVGGRGAGQVRFLQECYTEGHERLPCDVLCCRHTLEHIHSTEEFVALVRRVIGNRRDAIVFFEVPDTRRVFREQAFWDIYYEHCSYFSLGSLARVFRANRFDLLELTTDFDDQYLLIVARPVDGPTEAQLPEEDDLAQVKDEAEAFSAEVGARIGLLRSRVAALRDAGKRISIWGSGSKCVSFLGAVGLNDEVNSVVDINPHRQGLFLAGSGKQVVAPEALQGNPADVILVMNPIYREEIQQQIDGLGVSAELISV